MYIVMNRKPIINDGAYLCFARAVGLDLQNCYFSEYADDNKETQYVAVGPLSSGDAKTFYDIMAGAWGEPLILEVRKNGL